MITYVLLSGKVLITPFYDSQQPLYELTNFSKHAITVDKIYYPTSEHYFQAQKFRIPVDNRLGYLSAVSGQGNTPKAALDIATKWTQNWTSSDWASWNQRKELVMEDGLRAKLKQHPQILQLLLSTRDTCLVEDTTSRNERIWGWGNDGKGENKLGKLWMKLRNEAFIKVGENHLVVNVQNLYQAAQNERIPLGVKRDLLQTWPEAKPVVLKSNPLNQSVPSLVQVASMALKTIKPGQSYQAQTKGHSLSYGVSKIHKTFYIRGKGKNNVYYDVYVKNDKIFENQKLVHQSNWANWALPIVWQDMGKRNLRKGTNAKMPPKTLPPESPSTSSSKEHKSWLQKLIDKIRGK